MCPDFGTRLNRLSGLFYVVFKIVYRDLGMNALYYNFSYRDLGIKSVKIDRFLGRHSLLF